jgi:tetratricopeptide (TPR) repeat protein
MDASQVANFNDSFSEALSYISKAVDLLRKEEQPELLAQAHMRKGTLLYTWAQQGNPQFYKGAMEALQEAAKVFSRDAAPQQFAEIQHLLGIIYSEIPDEAKKKGVWAAVSSSSFKEALRFFTKELYPYEYATICNHYANAYIKYPASRNSDNVAKALEMFNQALEIRTADRYPIERVLTLLNYVEASWYADNSQEQIQQQRLNDMKDKLQEIQILSKDENIIREASQHIKKLKEIETSLNASIESK